MGWILSASEIKLVTPAIISDTRQTVTSTIRLMINFRALVFCTAASAFIESLILCTQYSGLQSKAAEHKC